MLNMHSPFTCEARRDQYGLSRVLLRTVLCASTVMSVGFLSLTATAQAPPPGQLRTPFGFQGARYDEETGLYYFRNRYYDPRTGRFLQRDPKHDPANMGNPYTFVGNSPISRRDPLGLQQAGPGQPVWTTVPAGSEGVQSQPPAANSSPPIIFHNGKQVSGPQSQPPTANNPPDAPQGNQPTAAHRTNQATVEGRDAYGRWTETILPIPPVSPGPDRSPRPTGAFQGGWDLNGRFVCSDSGVATGSAPTFEELAEEAQKRTEELDRLAEQIENDPTAGVEIGPPGGTMSDEEYRRYAEEYSKPSTTGLILVRSPSCPTPQSAVPGPNVTR
jgi:RHS repeat-associated protein